MSLQPSDSPVFVSQDQIQQLVDGLSKAVCAEIQQVIRMELPLAVKEERSHVATKDFAMKDSHDSVPRERRHSLASLADGGFVDHAMVVDSTDSHDESLPPALGGRLLANSNRIVKRLHEFEDYNKRIEWTSAKSHHSGEVQKIRVSTSKQKKVVLPGCIDEGTLLHQAAQAEDRLPGQNWTSEVDGAEGDGGKKSTKNPRELRVITLPTRSSTDEASLNSSHRYRRSGSVQAFTQHWCLRIVRHRWFTLLTVILISVNACTIGLSTDWGARNLDEESHPVFDVCEVLFCLAFSLELAFRIGAYQARFFLPQASEEESEWRWNWFDSFLVLAQIVELSIAAAVDRDKNVGINISFLRVLRVLRVVRVIRLVRIVHLISELRTIIASILGSLKSLGFTIVIIVFLIYIMAVFLTQVVTDTLRDNDDTTAISELQEWFESVPLSCLTLFQSMTNGVDWASVVNPLIDHVSPVMAVVFSIFIAFTNFAMLNVITGVFVESAITMDSAEKDTAMVARLYEFLSKSHVDGILTWDDFKSSLEDPAIQLYFKTVDLDIGEAHNLFLLLDADQNGCVQTEEFVTGCLRLKGDAKAIDLATLMYDTRRWQMGMTKNLSEFKAVVLTLLQHVVDSPAKPASTSYVQATANAKNNLGLLSMPVEDTSTQFLNQASDKSSHSVESGETQEASRCPEPEQPYDQPLESMLPSMCNAPSVEYLDNVGLRDSAFISAESIDPSRLN